MTEISELLRKARWYVEVYDTPEDNPEQATVLTDIDAALAGVEGNAGEPVAWGEEIDGKIVSVRLDKSRHCTVPLYRAPQLSGPVLPKLENCGTYFAKDNTGQWHYINHAGTWQGCPPPFPQPSGTVEALKRIAQLKEVRRGGGVFDYEPALSAMEMYEIAFDALSALTAGKPHPDDEAVDRFAAAMKAKLKWEREERGRHGWNDPSICPESYLARLLIEHLAKGNDGNFEDVANFCMMLHQRGSHPRVLADALTSSKAVRPTRGKRQRRKDHEQETD